MKKFRITYYEYYGCQLGTFLFPFLSAMASKHSEDFVCARKVDAVKEFLKYYASETSIIKTVIQL